MVYVTGDTHGTYDTGKLSPSKWPQGQMLGRNDYLVVLGDFGAILGDARAGDTWKLSQRDIELLEWWESQPWTTLFVDGNHEDFNILDSFDTEDMFGGKVQVVPGYPHIIHFMRGEVYDLPVSDGETARCFVMGGAQSFDRSRRIENYDWWAREMPSDEEYRRAKANLEDAAWSVDYVFTHEVPYNAMVDALDWQWWIERRDPPSNELAGYLQWVDDRLDKTSLKMWYAGHYHIDRLVKDEKHCVLYNSVVRLGDTPGSDGNR